MSKKELLEILKLLSAMESWSFSTSKNIPDYLLDRLDHQIKRLEQEVLK